MQGKFLCPHCEKEVILEISKVCEDATQRTKQVIEMMESRIGKNLPEVSLKEELNMEDDEFKSIIATLKSSGYIEVPREGFVRRIFIKKYDISPFIGAWKDIPKKEIDQMKALIERRRK